MEMSQWKRPKIMLVIILIVLFIAVVTIFLLQVFTPGTSDCQTRECFTELANQCKPATYYINELGTIYKFTTDNKCMVIKEVVTVAPDEPYEIRALFKGTSMKCTYVKNNFDERLIDSLMGGLEACTGSLKEASYELALAQYDLMVEDLRQLYLSEEINISEQVIT